MRAVLKKFRTGFGAAAAVADALLERREPAPARRLARRERLVETAAASLLMLTAAAMALVASPDGDATTAVLLTLLYALVRRVRFPLGPGLIRPTQIVFVPMLFLTPAAAVPALVVVGSLIGELPEIVRRRAHPERLLVTIADGWYAVGPAIVIAALAEGGAHNASWGVLLLALAAQVSFDLAATALREGLGAAIRPDELLPVLVLVYVIDALLAPIGYLAVLASDVHQHAYLLAIAPSVLLGLIARERSGRIARELALERAFRRSTRALDARAADLRRQAGWLRRPDRRVGETAATVEDRAALERVLLTTTIEAVQADGGRLSALDPDGALVPRLELGRDDGSLAAAEQSLGAVCSGALAIAVGHSHVLSVARAAGPFSAVERDLLEHLAAQAAVSLENLGLEELMRRTEAELRAILEGVADGIAAEDPEGRLVYVNAAAARLLDGADELGVRLGIPAERLPGRRVLSGATAETLVVRHPGEPRWSRVKASPVLEDGGARLAISVIEDITEIKQAEESQRFLAESSRALAGSLELSQTLPAVARLVAGNLADACAIHLLEDGELRLIADAGRADPADIPLVVPIPVRDGVAGQISLFGGRVDAAVAEDLALRAGAAIDNARLYHTRAAIAKTLQRSLLPPELPEIHGIEAAAHFRPAGEGHEVGGDFYDLFSTGDREWFAVIGDVSGKGAEAASVTALARYTIRAAIPRHRSPAGVLRSLNDAMLRQRAGRFVTIALARLQLGLDGTVTATVACGGHPSPRLLRATGLVETLGAPGTLLGVLADVELADRGARLSAGDALVLYTDGLIEAGAPRVWSGAHLDAAVAGGRGRDAQGIVDHLVERAVAEADGPLRDDLALLALRVQPLL